MVNSKDSSIVLDLNTFHSYGILQSIQSQLLKKLTTGNTLYDTFLSVLIVSNQDKIFVLLKLLKSGIIRSPFTVWNVLLFFIKVYKRYRKNKISSFRLFGRKRVFEYTTKIKYITDNREINELYEPVLWYINTLTTFDNTRESLLEETKQIKNIVQMMPPTRESFFHFQNKKIHYNLTKEIIEIYADRQYKRENMILSLTVRAENSAIFKELCDKAKKEYTEHQKKKEWRQYVYRNDEKGEWVGKPSKSQRKIETIILKKGQMEDIREDIDSFIKDKDWYISRDLPYTRRFLLYGPPGTGKSSLIKAIASRTKRHIYYLILSHIKSDEQLFRIMEKINYENTILVIEDIDCASDIIASREKENVVTKLDDVRHQHTTNTNAGAGISTPITENSADENKKERSTLTLSGLLNAIDGGIIDTHGQILIMTTNFPKKLDAALIRAGRVDRKFELSNCDEYQIEHLYKNFFDREPPCSLPSNINLEKVSPADITSIFLRYRKNPKEAWHNLCNTLST